MCVCVCVYVYVYVFASFVCARIACVCDCVCVLTLSLTCCLQVAVNRSEGLVICSSIMRDLLASTAFHIANSEIRQVRVRGEHADVCACAH